MKINKALNLVIPVESDEGVVYLHSTPISREVFERYFLVISKTFAAIYAEGLNALGGPRVAAMMLKRIAVDAGVWEGDGGVEMGLMAEIRRLTNVILPGPNGWTSMPLYDAVNRGHLAAEDADEAEGAIVFFICISAMHKRAQVPAFLTGLCSLWNTETTYSNSTEFTLSLPTSTATATSPPTVKPSSLPG